VLGRGPATRPAPTGQAGITKRTAKSRRSPLGWSPGGLRLDLSTDILARLLGTSRATICRTVKETRQLLNQLGALSSPLPHQHACQHTSPVDPDRQRQPQ
jgi:hypothetical protein